MGMSRVSLFKRVKSATGLSPQEFIRMVRITRAAQYLRESHTPIAEIAFLTGFSETRYFSRYFRDQYGMLPSHYRKSSGR
jgi:AraC-like DNA-binding protein